MADRGMNTRQSVRPRWQTERLLSGRAALADRRYNEKRTDERWKNDRRRRARWLCEKYGVRLSFYDKLGWYPPDIREALNGH